MRSAKLLGGLLLLTACHDPHGDPRPRAAAPSASASAASSSGGAKRELAISAEQRRDSAAIGSESLSSRDVKLRRSAARALSRIADARAAELLLLALADEDSEVVSWAAYGLGYVSQSRAEERARFGRAPRRCPTRARDQRAWRVRSKPSPTRSVAAQAVKPRARCARGCAAPNRARKQLRSPSDGSPHALTSWTMARWSRCSTPRIAHRSRCKMRYSR